MGNLIVKIFPAGAIIIAVFAAFFPQVLEPLDFTIVPLLGIIMLGMGSTLSLKDFQHAVCKPRAVVTGIVLQFLLMPLLAFLIGKALDLPREQFIGLVMVGTVAGGTASNVITYLVGGDVALSITMTACSTVAGIVLTPLLSQLYLAQTVAVPAWEMFKSILLMVALPVGIGLIINRLCRRQTALINAIAPAVSALGIVLVIGVVVSLNSAKLYSCGAVVLLAVILHNASGMAAGYFLAKLVGCDFKSSITIAIEVGMQNSGLAAALAKTFFGAAATLPGAIFSVWHNISGAILAAWVNSHRKNPAQDQQNDSTQL